MPGRIFPAFANQMASIWEDREESPSTENLYKGRIKGSKILISRGEIDVLWQHFGNSGSLGYEGAGHRICGSSGSSRRRELEDTEIAR